jgi:hypothetical protein
VSLMTKRQVTMVKGARGKAQAAQGRARQLGASQSVRARQAAAQMAPLAKSAQVNAQQGVYNARVWAAPRLDRMGHALQEQVAPKMSTMLSATARKIEPASRTRRRWPIVAAGMVMIAGGLTAAAVMFSRRSMGSVTPLGRPEDSASPSAAPHDMAAESASADVNGHGHPS